MTFQPGEVTRATLHGPDARFYYDADENVVRIARCCKTCGAWPEDEPHVPPCSPAQSMADTMERLWASIYRLGHPR